MRSFGFVLAAVIAGLGFLSSVIAHETTSESSSWLMRPVPNTVMIIGLCVLLVLLLGGIVIGRIVAMGYRFENLRRKPSTHDRNPPTQPIPIPPETAPEVHRVNPPEASGF